MPTADARALEAQLVLQALEAGRAVGAGVTVHPGVGPGGATDLRSALVVCRGELDPVMLPLLVAALRAAVDLSSRRVVVDVHEVTFFDAGALGAFVRAARAVHARGDRFGLVGVSAFGMRVLDAVELGRLVDQPIRAARSIAVEQRQQHEIMLEAGSGRAIVEQAKGVLAYRFSISIDCAEVLLGDCARHHHTFERDIAGRLLNGALDLDDLAPHHLSDGGAGPGALGRRPVTDGS